MPPGAAKSPEASKSSRPTWRENITAISALLGPFITAFTVLVAFLALQTGNEATNRTLETARAELRLAERGQITDRFTSAVEQLGREEGDGQLAIRLGGIYALERIMRDSQDDERNVVEVLSAFVREHTRTARPSGSPPGTDVQAALTVLGRRANAEKSGFGLDPVYGIVDLRNSRLEGADLRGTHFEGAHLEGSNLDLANLEGAFLQTANLAGAILFATNLTRADLRDARMDGSEFDEGTRLQAAIMNGASLVGTHLARADLSAVVGLESGNLRCAISDGETKLPADVVIPADRAGCGSA